MTHRILRLIIFSFLLFACQTSEDSLDAIKPFKPKDKYFKASLVSLHFQIETSSIAEVDTVFKQVMQHYNLPVDASGCKDGIYTGESPYDAYDYKHVVKIKIKNAKIVSVDYNEVHKSGIGKQEDEAYGREMSIAGTTPAEAYPAMEKQLLERQNIMSVDAVTGASYSLYRFRYALAVALMQARIARGTLE